MAMTILKQAVERLTQEELERTWRQYEEHVEHLWQDRDGFQRKIYELENELIEIENWRRAFVFGTPRAKDLAELDRLAQLTACEAIQVAAMARKWRESPELCRNDGND